MAGNSVRCLRSLTRVSLHIVRNTMSSQAQGLSQVKKMSSLTASTLVRADSNLLKSIARDNMVRNLAKRNARLSAAVCQLMTDIAVDITAADGERNCDDELSTEIADDDDKLRI